jgi:hypothetical protein
MATLTTPCGSLSALRGDHPWRWRRRLPWGRGRWGRPSRWGGGYAGHLIPFGVHTLDICHVIPGLQSRCGGTTGRRAARTSQDETTSGSNGCASPRMPNPGANECPSSRSCDRPYSTTGDSALARCLRRFYADLRPRILPAHSLIRLESLERLSRRRQHHHIRPRGRHDSTGAEHADSQQHYTPLDQHTYSPPMAL